MSCYMVSKAHVDALLSGALRYGHHYGFSWYWNGHRSERMDYTNTDAAGQMLVDANLASVYARYPDCDPSNGSSGEHTPGPIAQYWRRPYRFQRVEGFSPVELLKALDGFEYQACETEHWSESEAFALCQSLRKVLIHALPGYDDGPWAIEADTVPADVAAARSRFGLSDVLPTGETQPRLPGEVGAVREQECQQPPIAPVPDAFALTPPAETQPTQVSLLLFTIRNA